MPEVIFLLISKLGGPPSLFLPLRVAETRSLPPKRYVSWQGCAAEVLTSNYEIESEVVSIKSLTDETQ